MPITKVANVITYTAPEDKDLADQTGSMRSDQFSFHDINDETKQVKFDVSGLTTNTTTTLTVPSTSGTIATTSQLGGETVQLATSPGTIGGNIVIASSTTVLVTDGVESDAGAFTITLPTAPADGKTIKLITTNNSNLGAGTFVAPGATLDSNGFGVYDFAAERIAIITYVLSTDTWYVGLQA